MALFDKAIFDEAVFDVGAGAGVLPEDSILGRFGEWVPIDKALERALRRMPKPPRQIVSPDSVPSDEAVGIPRILLRVRPAAVASEAVVGEPTVRLDMRRIHERELLELLMLDAA